MPSASEAISPIRSSKVTSREFRDSNLCSNAYVFAEPRIYSTFQNRSIEYTLSSCLHWSPNNTRTLLRNTKELSTRRSVGTILLKRTTAFARLFYDLGSSVTMGNFLRLQVFRARKRHSPFFSSVGRQFAHIALKQ